MQKIIALLTAGCLTLAVSVQAEKPEAADAKKQKQPKNVQKQQVAPRQQVAPKQHQLKTQNVNVQKQHVERVNKPVTNTVNTNVLSDPTLELHDSNGATLVTNDNWTDDSAAADLLRANGLALANPTESAIFTSLPPGQFTAILAGKNGVTGVGTIEIYNLR